MERNEKTPRAMQEKLREDYILSDLQGNKGHAIGFYRQSGEEIKGMYRFEKGLFTLRSRHENFFWWDFDAEKAPKNRRRL